MKSLEYCRELIGLVEVEIDEAASDVDEILGATKLVVFIYTHSTPLP